MSGRRSDPGLQPERTALAWRRTVLAVVVAALVSMRLLPPLLGGWGLAAASAVLAAAGALWCLSGRRVRLRDQALADPARPAPGGALLLLLAALVAVPGLVGLLVVLTRELDARP